MHYGAQLRRGLISLGLSDFSTVLCFGELSAKFIELTLELPGQLVSDHGGELLRGPGPQVDRNHVRQQPGQRRVIEPGRQHVLPPLPHRPVQRSLALEPGPVPGGVLSDKNTTTAAACSP